MRRRRWKRSMIFDHQNQATSLPFVLTIRIKSATFTSKLTPSKKLESYVDLFIDNVFYDKTTTGTPNWNKTVIKEFLYLEPDTHLCFKLYRKVMSGFVLKGVLSINIRDLALNANKGPIERSYPLAEADQKRYLLLEFDLKEFRFFAVKKHKIAELDELAVRDAFNRLPPSLWADINQAFPNMSSISDIIIDSLTEIPDVMRQQDISDIISDIYKLKQQSNSKHRQTAVDQISLDQSRKSVVYPYGKYYYSKCIVLNTLLGVSDEKKTLIINRQKSMNSLNYAISNNQPFQHSIFDLSYENHLTSDVRNNVIDAYDFNILTTQNASYEFQWQNPYDYFMVLKELSRIRFLKYEGITPSVTVIGKYNNSSRVWKDISFLVNYETEFIIVQYFDFVVDENLSSKLNRKDSRRLSSSVSSFKKSNLEEETKIYFKIPFIEVNYKIENIFMSSLTRLKP